MVFFILMRIFYVWDKLNWNIKSGFWIYFFWIVLGFRVWLGVWSDVLYGDFNLWSFWRSGLWSMGFIVSECVKYFG